MTDSEKMVVLIAIASAKNCIHVFEDAYPGDDRPRQALEAAEKWFNETNLAKLCIARGPGESSLEVKGLD